MARLTGCLVEGCDGEHYGRGYCHKHNLRLRRHGDPLGSARKIKPIEFMDGYALVELTRGFKAKIDVADASNVGRHNWHARVDGNTVYAWSTIRTEETPYTIPLHRFLLGSKDGQIVDHIDGDGLNNMRGNLRPATASQNQHNKRLAKNNQSGFKGVRFAPWATGPVKWRASIFHNGRNRSLGYYATAEEAAAAYDNAALETFGSFALLNSQMVGG